MRETERRWVVISAVVAAYWMEMYGALVPTHLFIHLALLDGQGELQVFIDLPLYCIHCWETRCEAQRFPASRVRGKKVADYVCANGPRDRRDGTRNAHNACSLSYDSLPLLASPQACYGRLETALCSFCIF